MQIADVPFMTTDWSTLHPTEHRGTTGVALWRTIEQGNVRVRMVEYSAGYQADHWCHRGHVLLVLEGELVTELELSLAQQFAAVHGCTRLASHVAPDAVPFYEKCGFAKEPEPADGASGRGSVFMTKRL